MLVTSMIFGLAWGIKYGASGEQALMIAIFGASVVAVSLFPLILLANHSINEEIRTANRKADREAKAAKTEADRRERRDAATLRVIRHSLLEWAVREGQVDKIDGLAENLLVALKDHRSEVRAQRNRPPTYALITPLGTVG
jgi:hypothetical protein